MKNKKMLLIGTAVAFVMLLVQPTIAQTYQTEPCPLCPYGYVQGEGHHQHHHQNQSYGYGNNQNNHHGQMNRHQNRRHCYR